MRVKPQFHVERMSDAALRVEDHRGRLFGYVLTGLGEYISASLAGNLGRNVTVEPRPKVSKGPAAREEVPS